jgi:hypothetical protein
MTIFLNGFESLASLPPCAGDLLFPIVQDLQCDLAGPRPGGWVGSGEEASHRTPQVLVGEVD